MPKQLTEVATITEAAAAVAEETGLLPIQFVSPGWGSSGYYSAEVLEQAAVDVVIPAGTHMYADHPTEEEHKARPVRSIKDIVAVVVGDARIATEADVATWDADLGALVGEAQVVPEWQPLIKTVRKSIGTSIRGSATDIVEGEAEGKIGGIIESLVAPVLSVDFVTRAGRGGKVLSVIESARANKKAIGHGVSEATVNDTREGLQTVLRDTYGGEKTYVWVRDFDDTTVWFEVEAPDDSGIFAQTYTEDAAGAVALDGDRTEVRVRTEYVPVTRPDSTTSTTEADLEVTMGKIQIEESEVTALREKAGRADTLESEVATEKARADKAEGTLAEEAAAGRTAAAVKIIEERSADSEIALTPADVIGLVSDLPVKEGALDTEAFTNAVNESIAKKSEANGDGKVTGMGGTATAVAEAGADPWSAIDKHLDINKGA